MSYSFFLIITCLLNFYINNNPIQINSCVSIGILSYICIALFSFNRQLHYNLPLLLGFNAPSKSGLVLVSLSIIPIVFSQDSLSHINWNGPLHLLFYIFHTKILSYILKFKLILSLHIIVMHNIYFYLNYVYYFFDYFINDNICLFIYDVYIIAWLFLGITHKSLLYIYIYEKWEGMHVYFDICSINYYYFYIKKNW